jgi:uridine kinase
MKKPYVIGIGGGTSSGKTTVATEIINNIDEESIAYLSYDNYYNDLSDLDPNERSKINFDHPSSLDTDRLISDVKCLAKGESIETPIYDFVTHTRRQITKIVTPKKIILIEGILTLANIDLRELMDIKIFVDTEADERLIRRITRDINDRARNFDDIIVQYKTTVKPMHQQFIEPSKAYADIIIPSGYNDAAVKMVINGILKISNNF